MPEKAFRRRKAGILLTQWNTGFFISFLKKRQASLARQSIKSSAHGNNACVGQVVLVA
ncbi:hypothetical protein SpAn4DRAFT_3821 [Sporomusa ovata]|uniref:Uncharacterized protein n=1 Tax=Sporomusa ovata TaxID=2378 RepID=A0A0U1KVF4_9FIRM|nr:hypothetical protein SpAn4DRAFT_3821 [Sporomusa ovata]